MLNFSLLLLVTLSYIINVGVYCYFAKLQRNIQLIYRNNVVELMTPLETVGREKELLKYFR